MTQTCWPTRPRTLDYFPCPECGRPFSRRFDILRHLRQTHGLHHLAALRAFHRITPVKGRQDSVIRLIDQEDRYHKGGNVGT